MLLDRLDVDAAAFAQGTGWAIKPEGACRGDVCVPLPAGTAAGGRVDVPAVAERLGMPLVADDAHGVWALGPATVTGRALATAEAPALSLPDLEGRPFDLAGLRGHKVVILAWASW